MSNTLYPVFLKPEKLSLLIIGGGSIALEKLESVVANSPKVSIKLVAKEILPEVKALKRTFPDLTLYERAYETNDFRDVQLVIAAVNNVALAEQIQKDAHHCNLLVNIADQPELSDFYLGSIVKKGTLKIAISPNGKFPTINNRIREILVDTIPDEMDEVLDNMHNIRNQLKGDFNLKTKELNKLKTQYLNDNKEKGNHPTLK